jgi:hypothetical protein
VAPRQAAAVSITWSCDWGSLLSSRFSPTKEAFMSTSAFDTFARQAAAGVSRRASLRLLGGAPLAALLGPSIVGAKTSAKKARKKAKQKAQKQCLAQVGQCRAYFTGKCEPPDPSECEARIARCCEFLGSCDTASFLSCLLES